MRVHHMFITWSLHAATQCVHQVVAGLYCGYSMRSPPYYDYRSVEAIKLHYRHARHVLVASWDTYDRV